MAAKVKRRRRSLLFVQKIADHAIVLRCPDERLNREAFAKFQCRFALVIAHRFEYCVVIGGIHDDRDRFVILRRAPDHRRAADIDVLNCFRQSYVRLRDRGFERIKIDDHQVDRIKAAFTRFCFVFRIAALVKKPAVHAGMQSFYTAIEHFGKCGETQIYRAPEFFRFLEGPLFRLWK